jgi:hypothetical protein
MVVLIPQPLSLPDRGMKAKTMKKRGRPQVRSRAYAGQASLFVRETPIPMDAVFGEVVLALADLLLAAYQLPREENDEHQDHD